MSPGRTTLLADAPAGRHIGQLHRGRQSLTQAVHQFADPALRAGQAVVLIASAFHTALYLGPCARPVSTRGGCIAPGSSW